MTKLNQQLQKNLQVCTLLYGFCNPPLLQNLKKKWFVINMLPKRHISKTRQTIGTDGGQQDVAPTEVSRGHQANMGCVSLEGHTSVDHFFNSSSAAQYSLLTASKDEANSGDKMGWIVFLNLLKLNKCFFSKAKEKFSLELIERDLCIAFICLFYYFVLAMSVLEVDLINVIFLFLFIFLLLFFPFHNKHLI